MEAIHGKMVREHYCLVNSPTNERRLGHQSLLRYRYFAAGRLVPARKLWRVFPLVVDRSSVLVESENAMCSNAAQIEPRFGFRKE